MSFGNAVSLHNRSVAIVGYYWRSSMRNAFLYMDGQGWSMEAETRVAVMGIIVDDMNSVERLNELLHNCSEYIIGRMGIPYRKRNISIMSIAIDAPQDVISALTGKIGNLHGISVKTAYSNVISRIQV